MTSPNNTPDAAYLQRYSRQLQLPEVGDEGQKKLGRARVLVIGAGGLGSPVALYLAAAGVGTLGLADADAVDLSNLQRQILHSMPAVGQMKTESAARRLRELNPTIQVNVHPVRLGPDNAENLIANYDLVMDCCDNFTTRYVLNAACQQQQKTWIYGAISRFEGQLAVFPPGQPPCYRCLFPDEPDRPPQGQELGVLGVVPGLIGVLQAGECLKWILGIGRSLSGRLLMVDARQLHFREIAIPVNPACPVCGQRHGLTRTDTEKPR